jgi:hypothetical protein
MSTPYRPHVDPMSINFVFFKRISMRLTWGRHGLFDMQRLPTRVDTMSTPCQPHVDPMSTPCQPHILITPINRHNFENHKSQPHVNPMSTPYLRCPPRNLDLMSNPVSTPCWSHVNPMSTISTWDRHEVDMRSTWDWHEVDILETLKILIFFFNFKISKIKKK